MALVSPDEEYFNLGAYKREVTGNLDGEEWFNRGLIWTYAFNHEEAAYCFQQAIDHDPNCAMAYWGYAFAIGPNYNKPWESIDEQDETRLRAHKAAADAKAKVDAKSPIEKALIEALQLRYPSTSLSDPSEWNQSYANAMESVYTQFPDDLDVAVLYVDSLMNLTPWQLWDIKTGEPAPGARTLDAKNVLDRALAQTGGNAHPGLLHLYIHLMEMSNTPEAALPAADHLRGLVPDAGHLQHMPTHIDILCGDYQQAITSNSDAIVADKKFFARADEAKNTLEYKLYMAHNYHFLIYGAMFSGRLTVALNTIAELEALLPQSLLQIKKPPVADWLESFLSIRVHILIRFGLWENIFKLKFPEDNNLYCVTTAMIHYAKGIALAVIGKIEEAEKEKELFRQAWKRVPESRTLFNNKCIDILAIASAMLDGELEYRKGNFEVAFDHLRRSIELDDSLPYDEPWGWMQPTRHAYGALLLEQGHVEEAAAVYKADLDLDESLPRPQRHPNNIWALLGYRECLVRLGLPTTDIDKQYAKALANKDPLVDIKYSCFCRLGDS